MSNTKIDTTEIRKKATELFDLLEQNADAHGDDTLAEEIRDNIGDWLKSNRGFDLLQYGYEISLTKSEMANREFGEAIRFMNDESLSDLYWFARSAAKAAQLLDGNEIDSHALSLRTRDLKEGAPKILEDISIEWYSRTKGYKSEIKDLQGVESRD